MLLNSRSHLHFHNPFRFSSGMWLMGCSEATDHIKQEAFFARKVGPFLPRPIEQNKRELREQADGVVSSSRWNPTSEQLRMLEDLYRRGTRTPSADQIQHITLQLRKYGKIEGKNVFYWFQNHKARERQKRRRQMESSPPVEQRRGHERRESEFTRSAKNWAHFTSCSSPLAEEDGSMRGSGMAEGRKGEEGDGEGEVSNGAMERNGTWKTKQLSCPFPIRLINSTTCIPSATNLAAITPTQSITKEETTMTLDPQLFKTRELLNAINGDGCTNVFPTLQLFPVQSSSNCIERDSGSGEKDSIFTKEIFQVQAAEGNSNMAGFQFYEFLPLKN